MTSAEKRPLRPSMTTNSTSAGSGAAGGAIVRDERSCTACPSPPSTGSLMDAQESVPGHVVAMAVFLAPTRAMRKKEFSQSWRRPGRRRGSAPDAFQSRRARRNRPAERDHNARRGARTPTQPVSSNGRTRRPSRRANRPARLNAPRLRRVSARTGGDKFLLLGQRLRRAGAPKMPATSGRPTCWAS